MNGAGADEHPLPPRQTVRDWRWAVGILGRTFIVLGLLILAFVAYQLWGTGIEFRSNQSQLAKDFRRAVAAAPTTALTTTSTSAPALPAGSTSTTAPTLVTTTLAGPRVGEGDVLAALTFPTLSNKRLYVVSGVRLVDLKRGVGHYPGTALPGQYGNAALAGHRTTYGAPFENLDRLRPGDRILIDTADGGHFEYLVDSQEIIRPENVGVLSQPDDPHAALLTLTTCHPKRSTKRRLVVHAHLDVSSSSPAEARSESYATATSLAPGPSSTTTPPTQPAGVSGDSTVGTSTVAPSTTVAPTTTAAALAGEGDVTSKDAKYLAAGWFKDTAAWPHIILWGLLLTAIAVSAWIIGTRLRKRWVAVLVAAAPFVVVLYFFFQNVNRLLPPGL